MRRWLSSGDSHVSKPTVSENIPVIGDFDTSLAVLRTTQPPNSYAKIKKATELSVAGICTTSITGYQVGAQRKTRLLQSAAYFATLEI
jgi:hypothetical protein